MSPFSALLVVLVVLVSCVSAGTIQFYSDAACANTVGSSTSITFPSTVATCATVTGVTAIGSAQVTCASNGGTTTASFFTFSAAGCTSGNQNGVGAALSNACGTVSLTGGSGVAAVKINCNSAFSTHTLSIAVMLILAIIAMIAM